MTETDAPAPPEGMRYRLLVAALLCLALAALGIQAFQEMGATYHEGFRLPQGYGMYALLPAEGTFIALFTLTGLLVTALVAGALGASPVGELLARLAARAARRPGLVALFAAVALFSGALVVQTAVLGRAAVSDDEHVYRFIAATLRTGALLAPLPPVPTADLSFFWEQFVVLSAGGRYGKYPVGFPLLLAAGDALRVEPLVVPLLTAAVVFPLYRLGRRLYGAEVAALGAVLFALSPQALFTGATWLSQPAAALCAVAAVACLLTAERTAEPDGEALAPRAPWLVAAGAWLGYGVLVRPLPGVLFVAAAAGWWWTRRRSALASALLRLLAPVAVALAVLLLVNRAQAGSALTSGYQAFHHTGEGPAGILAFLQGGLGPRLGSVIGTWLRLDGWFLGWPLAMAACLLAPQTAGTRLIWMMVGAEAVYRLVSPKVGVGTVGPMYVFEVVPLLALLAAAGLVRAARDGLGGLRPGRAGVAALLAAGVLVETALFLPPKLADLGRAGAAQNQIPLLLAQRGVQRALVFHQGAVPPWTGLSWAYFPPCNEPGFDGPVVYALFQDSPAGLARARALAAQRFPDRRPMVFSWWKDQPPRLVDLADYQPQRGQPPAAP